MAKIKSKWICQNCGYETAGYLGKCPDCSSWGSIVEEVIDAKVAQMTFKDDNSDPPQLLNEIVVDEKTRFSSKMAEFDRVLGGGFVKGSLILIAGDPGIGKSTLLLQSSGNLASAGLKVLYVSAEESSSQIKLRAQRLNVQSDNLFIYSQTNLEQINEQVKSIKPDILIIDSIQAIFSQNISSSPGSVSQVRECGNVLMTIAKSLGITTITVGHVTKDGTVAGPKVLEHMVDAVIYFEGDRYKSYRILRSMKNRFGNTQEIGIFSMETQGLIEVSNPSELFLDSRSENTTPGTVVISTNEGSRPLLVEIQALVGNTSYPSPRRVATGIEYNRMLQILAVLEKRVGLNLSKHDVYLNVIGGIDIKETAADLGIALAVATCFRDVVVSPDTVIIGEIGLSGDIRSVNNIERRILEAEKLGFKKVVIPKSNLPLKNKFENIEIIAVSRLIEAITVSIQKD